MGRFAGVIGNTWDIVFRSLKFQGFNLVVNQIAAVFPVIIQARRYFSGQITLGDVQQTASAFSQVSAPVVLPVAYDDFAGTGGAGPAHRTARRQQGGPRLPTLTIEERPTDSWSVTYQVRLPEADRAASRSSTCA